MFLVVVIVLDDDDDGVSGKSSTTASGMECPWRGEVPFEHCPDFPKKTLLLECVLLNTMCCSSHRRLQCAATI